VVKTGGWNFLSYDALRLEIQIVENNCTRKKFKILQCQDTGWSQCKDEKLIVGRWRTQNIGGLTRGTGIQKLSVKQEKDRGGELTERLSGVLLENLIVAYLLKKSLTVYGTRRIIAVFTKPATGSYPGPDESNSHHNTLVLHDNINIMLPYTTRCPFKFSD
jgi:hypothetical protein